MRREKWEKFLTERTEAAETTEDGRRLLAEDGAQ